MRCQTTSFITWREENYWTWRWLINTRLFTDIRISPPGDVSRRQQRRIPITGGKNTRKKTTILKPIVDIVGEMSIDTDKNNRVASLVFLTGFESWGIGEKEKIHLKGRGKGIDKGFCRFQSESGSLETAFFSTWVTPIPVGQPSDDDK